VTGRRQYLDLEPARPEGVAGSIDRLEPEAAPKLGASGRVIAVPVRHQQMSRRQLVRLDHGQQRLERGTAVNEDARATWTVGDQIGIREPARMHAPLDDHVI
jgi:hypothetical protein